LGGRTARPADRGDAGTTGNGGQEGPGGELVRNEKERFAGTWQVIEPDRAFGERKYRLDVAAAK